MSAQVAAAAPPRRAKAWVAAMLVLLCVPGVIGFELWPLTGWRMYSRAASETRLDWSIEAETSSGPVDVAWPDLPLGYRLGAWPVASAYAGSTETRDRTCHAFLTAVRTVVPDAQAISLVRRRRILTNDAATATDLERERFHRCDSA